MQYLFIFDRNLDLLFNIPQNQKKMHIEKKLDR